MHVVVLLNELDLLDLGDGVNLFSDQGHFNGLNKVNKLELLVRAGHVLESNLRRTFFDIDFLVFDFVDFFIELWLLCNNFHFVHACLHDKFYSFLNLLKWSFFVCRGFFLALECLVMRSDVDRLLHDVFTAFNSLVFNWHFNVFRFRPRLDIEFNGHIVEVARLLAVFDFHSQFFVFPVDIHRHGFFLDNGPQDVVFVEILLVYLLLNFVALQLLINLGNVHMLCAGLFDGADPLHANFDGDLDFTMTFSRRHSVDMFVNRYILFNEHFSRA